METIESQALACHCLANGGRVQKSCFNDVIIRTTAKHNCWLYIEFNKYSTF